MLALHMHTIRARIVARGRRWLLVGAALLAPLVPAALMPETIASVIVLDWFESICLERIGGIAAATNALTLVP